MRSLLPATLLAAAALAASLRPTQPAFAQSTPPPPATDAGAATTDAPAPQSPADRARAATEAIHQSGAVPRCWNAFLRLEPNANSVRFRVRVALNAAGAVERVVLLDPAPTNLADCVRTQVRRVTVPAGEPVTVETTYAFSPGASAPVPSR